MRIVLIDGKEYKTEYSNAYQRGADKTGYGKKICSDYLVKFEGRLRRIYVCVFSNVGTTYIVVNGKDKIIH